MWSDRGTNASHPSAAQAALRPLAFTALSADPTHELARIHAQARTHGYAEGYAAGSRTAAQQAAQHQQQLQNRFDQQQRDNAAEHQRALRGLRAAADALQSRTLPAVETLEMQVIEAALQLAETILGRELRDGAHAARSALKRVLAEVEPEEIRAVRMHPETAAQLDKVALDDAGVRVHADPGLAPGDAVADLTEGFLDARITAALERCQEAVLKIRSGGAE